MSSSLVNNTCIIKNLFFFRTYSLDVHKILFYNKFYTPPPPLLKKEVKF